MDTLRLAGVEVFKLRKRRMTWILLSILIVLIVVLYVLLWAVTKSGAESFGGPQGGGEVEKLQKALYVQQAVPFGLQLTQVFGTFLGTILAGASVGSEYGWDTIRPYLTAAPGRKQFLAGKLLAIATMIVAGTLVGMITALATSAIISSFGGAADYGFVDAGYAGESLLSYARTVMAMAPFVAMSAFFALWGRSTMAGIGAAIGVFFLDGFVTTLMRAAGGWVEHVPNALPGANADALMHANGLVGVFVAEDDPSIALLLDPPVAALILAGYVVMFLALSFVIFERRDVRS